MYWPKAYQRLVEVFNVEFVGDVINYDSKGSKCLRNTTLEHRRDVGTMVALYNTFADVDVSFPMKSYLTKDKDP